MIKYTFFFWGIMFFMHQLGIEIKLWMLGILIFLAIIDFIKFINKTE